jgi:hypothetical protein
VPSCVVWVDPGSCYLVDFQRMEQVNMVTGRSRRVHAVAQAPAQHAQATGAGAGAAVGGQGHGAQGAMAGGAQAGGAGGGGGGAMDQVVAQCRDVTAEHSTDESDICASKSTRGLVGWRHDWLSESDIGGLCSLPRDVLGWGACPGASDLQALLPRPLRPRMAGQDRQVLRLSAVLRTHDR